MYIGESRCKQCNGPIVARWYNDKGSYDVGEHKLKKVAFLVDGTLNLKYECKECKEHNELILKYIE